MSDPIGCVDGIIDGELRGWIIDRHDPVSAERVICRNEEGRELVFRPFSFREDVAASMGMPGVFGFALPGDLLRPLGTTFSVFDCNGTILRNGSGLAVPAEPSPRRGRPEVHIFLHIAKTAGTSLRNTLLRTVPSGEVLLIYPGAMPGISLERAAQIPLVQRNRLGWVFGHCQFGFGRDVVPLGEVGADEVEIAVSNVRRHFAFVGRHAHATEDTTTLQTYLGLPLDPLTVDNVTPPTRRYRAEDLAAVDWDRVIARNQADVMLYSRLQDEGLVSRVLG